MIRKLLVLVVLLACGCSAPVVTPSGPPDATGHKFGAVQFPAAPAYVLAKPDAHGGTQVIESLDGGLPAWVSGTTYQAGPGIALDATTHAFSMAPTIVPGCCYDPVLCPSKCYAGHMINGGIWRWYSEGGVTPYPYPSYLGVGRIAVDNDAGRIGIDAAGLGPTYTGHAPITVDGSVIGIGLIAIDGGTNGNLPTARLVGTIDINAGTAGVLDAGRLGPIPPASLVAGTGGQVVMTGAGGTVANTTIGGDCTIASTGYLTCSSLGAGSVAYGASTGAFTWTKGDTAPGFTQSSAAYASTPVNTVIAPQAPNGANGTAAQNTPGSLVVNLAAPGTAGTAGAYPALNVNTGAVPTLTVTGSAAGSYLYLGQKSAFQLATSSTDLDLQSPASTGLIVIEHAGYVSQVNSEYGVQINTTAATDFGGGMGVLGISKAATTPTTSTTGALLWADHTSGALEMHGGGGIKSGLELAAARVGFGQPLAGILYDGGVAPLAFAQASVSIVDGGGTLTLDSSTVTKPKISVAGNTGGTAYIAFGPHAPVGDFWMLLGGVTGTPSKLLFTNGDAGTLSSCAAKYLTSSQAVCHVITTGLGTIYCLCGGASS
jgi:hypothetical protein